MSTVLAPATQPGQAPRFGRLIRAEFRRLVYRRFFRAVLVLAVLGFIAAMIAIFVRHDRVTAADQAAADRARDQQIAQIQQSIDECRKNVPADQADQQCGPSPTPQDFPSDLFLKVRPLEPRQLSDYGLAIGVATALLGFVLGATFIGAEWSSKNLIAWLFWEPRRLRLMAAKLLVLLSVVLAFSVLLQAIFFGVSHLLLHYRGLPVSSTGPLAKHFWRHLIDAQARGALLVLPTTLIGYGLANLIRNSAAAYGIGFVYFAVVETLIHAINPEWQPYLLTVNVGAWISNGGLTVFGKPAYDRTQGFVAPRPIHLSNLHGAVVLIIYAGVITVFSLALFRRRDLN